MMHLPFFALYFAVLLVLCGYGLHRSHLVLLFWRHRKQVPLLREGGKEPISTTSTPFVTIQLPLYNEATVVARLLRAVAHMDYPKNRFEIQVLDDSTDETRHIVDREVGRLRDAGVDAVVVRRSDRVGYKAGALDAGLKVAKGELVAIFDADFVPQPDFLRRLVGEFRDPT
ncbi:MAG TPA: glycosyltransferase, partial [Polyangiaceae bacterium]|nr:glycosyltransferase [Polyangiaceae bacterium]